MLFKLKVIDGAVLNPKKQRGAFYREVWRRRHI